MSNFSTSYDQYSSPKLYSQLLGDGYNGSPTGEYGGKLNPSSFGIDEVSAGSGPLTSQDKAPAGGYKDMARGATASMNAGGTAGQALTGAGIYGLMAEGGTAAAAAGPYALAAGLALTAYENSKKADAMNEQARVEEAQNRKAATQNAINSMINVTRGLGV